MRIYIDEDGVLLSGRFEGETLEEVNDEEPEYLEWMLENCALEPEERQQLYGALGEKEVDLPAVTG